MRNTIVQFAMAGFVIASGCDSAPAPSATTAAAPAVTVPPPPPAPPQPNPPLVNATGDGTTTVPPGTTTENASSTSATQQPAGGGDQSPANDPNMETVKAGGGVGIKGRSLDQHEGIIVTPVKTYFRAKERIVFEIELPHALNLYIATEGEGPKDYADLQAKVIEPNNIHLPALPPGHRYDYNAETHELVVVRPKAGTKSESSSTKAP
jgi:hypothetical protein